LFFKKRRFKIFLNDILWHKIYRQRKKSRASETDSMKSSCEKTEQNSFLFPWIMAPAVPSVFFSFSRDANDVENSEMQRNGHPLFLKNSFAAL